MTRNLGEAVLMGAASRGVAILLRFFSVPLTLSLLSVEQYGLWMVISSLVTWFGFSDLGIPSALQNRLVTVLQTGDVARARALVAYALRMIVLIAGMICALAAVAFFVIQGFGGVGMEQTQMPEFAIIFGLCLATFSLGLPSRLGGVLFSAHGRLNAVPLSELVAQLAAFLMLLVAVALKWKSLLALVACSLISIAVVPMGLTWLAFQRLDYRMRTREIPSADDRRAILGKGVFFFLTTIGELLILQSDTLLIGAILGVAMVPIFMIPAALWLNFLQAQNIFLRPLWPVLSKVRVEGNSAGFAMLLKRAFWISLAGGMAFGLGLIVAGDWFIKMWSKGVAGLPPLMAYGFAAYAVVASIDNMLATVMNASGMIEKRFRYTLFFGVSKLVVGWWVLVKFGIEALPITYALIMLTTSVPFAAFCVGGLLRERPRDHLAR